MEPLAYLTKTTTRKGHWLERLLARADEIEREQPAAMEQPAEITGNVVQLRPRRRMP